MAEPTDTTPVAGRAGQLGRRAGRLIGGLGRQLGTAGEPPPHGDHVVALRARYGDAVSEGPFTDQLLIALGWLFPDGLDDDSAARIKFVTDPTQPVTVAVIRRIIGMVDQQRAPTAAVFRFGGDDLEHHQLDGPLGVPLTVLLDTADASVSVQVREPGGYEPHLARVLDRLLQPGSVFVDVGANIGYHSLRAAQAVGPGGRVIAVEAGAENARLLAAAAHINGFAHLEVMPFALGADLGHAAFGSHIGSNAGMHAAGASGDVHLADLLSSATTVVPVLPLDLLGLDRIDVMKVDVEGAESAVLAGARRTIERCRPVIVTEFSAEMTRRVGGVEPEVHIDRILALGYRLEVIDRGGAGPTAYPSAAALLADWGDPLRIEDLLFTPLPS